MRHLWFIPIMLLAMVYWNRPIHSPDSAPPPIPDRQNSYKHFLTGSKIDLNRASQEDLEAIPGIGPSTAGAIIHYRDRHGPFHSIQELQDVHGIGPKTVEKITPFLIVSE